jgi:hypothetical protein
LIKNSKIKKSGAIPKDTPECHHILSVAYHREYLKILYVSFMFLYHKHAALLIFISSPAGS